MREPVPRTALVTGANRGIGLEVCRQLGRLGLRIVLTGRDLRAAERAAAQLAREGYTVLPEVMNVSSPDSVQDCAERLRLAEEHVDVLVNNAGIYPQGKLLPLSDTVMREALDTNFFGALRTAQEFVPGMLRRN